MSKNVENSTALVEEGQCENKGKAIFASNRYHKGDLVIVGRPIGRFPERTWLSVQMGQGSHVKMDLPFETVNHSCSPSCGLQNNEFGGYSLFALQDILPGEEITFDYCTCEWECVGMPPCLCGSNDCRGDIRGARFILDFLREKYGPFIADYMIDHAGVG